MYLACFLLGQTDIVFIVFTVQIYSKFMLFYLSIFKGSKRVDDAIPSVGRSLVLTIHYFYHFTCT